MSALLLFALEGSPHSGTSLPPEVSGAEQNRVGNSGFSVEDVRSEECMLKELLFLQRGN